MSKLSLTVDGLRVIDIKPTEYSKVFESPAKCAHYSGFEDTFSRDVSIPEDCLTCPKILQCGIRKQ
jgi:hypothetical protein